MLVFCSNSKSLWTRMNAWVVSTIPCSSHPRMVVIAEANHVRGWSGIFVSRSLGDWWGYNQEPTISWGIFYSILGILLWFIGIFEQQHGDINGNCRLVLVIQQFAMVWTVRLLDDEVAIFHSKLSNNQRAYVVWGYLGHAKRNPSRFDSYIHPDPHGLLRIYPSISHVPNYSKNGVVPYDPRTIGDLIGIDVLLMFFFNRFSIGYHPFA